MASSNPGPGEHRGFGSIRIRFLGSADRTQGPSKALAKGNGLEGVGQLKGGEEKVWVERRADGRRYLAARPGTGAIIKTRGLLLSTDKLRTPRPGKEKSQPNLPASPVWFEETFKHCRERGSRLIYRPAETINTERENSQRQPGLGEWARCLGP